MKADIIQIRDSVEESANDLNQICSTMEILLSSMYEASEAANPMREAMALIWKNTLEVRDRLFGSCMDADTWKRVSEAQKENMLMYALNDSGYGFFEGGC